MTLTEILEDKEKEPSKPQLRVITGGKGTPEGPSDNWLIKLNKGSVFSCKRKGVVVDLELYGISFKHTKTIVLFNALGTSPPRAVDPVEFCKHYDKFEVIDEGGEEPPKEENNDGIRTLRPPGMEDDVDAARGQPEHEET